MSGFYHTETTPQLICWDRTYYNDFDAQLEAYKTTRTVYVGNLSFFTTESQIRETFSVVGPIKRVIMGLNNITKTPCGFCFVEYYTRESYMACLKYLSDTICDDRVVRCDADGGFKPGRQFGRGRSGGQVRDERRTDLDPARGGVLQPPLLLGKRRRRDDNDDDGNKRKNKGGRGDIDNNRPDQFGRDMNMQQDPVQTIHERQTGALGTAR